MSTVSDYAVYTDLSFVLDTNGDIDLMFTRTLNGTPVSGEQALLFWVEQRTGGAGSLSYEVKVNTTVIGTFSVSSDDSHSMHEGFDPAILVAGANTVTFTLTAAAGAARFGDVVLFFRQTA